MGGPRGAENWHVDSFLSPPSLWSLPFYSPISYVPLHSGTLGQLNAEFGGGELERKRERAEYSERTLLFFWQDGWMVLSPEHRHVSQCLSVSVSQSLSVSVSQCLSDYFKLQSSDTITLSVDNLCQLLFCHQRFNFDAKNPTSQITTTYHWSSPFLCSRWRWRQSELTLMKQGQSDSGDGFKWFILFKWRTSLKNWCFIKKLETASIKNGNGHRLFWIAVKEAELTNVNLHIF